MHNLRTFFHRRRLMRKDLIDSSIATLIASYGSIRVPVDDIEFERMFTARDFVGMAAAVKRVLRMDARLILVLINNDYEGRPHGDVWVKRPHPMAPFGSVAFRQTLVTVYVRKSFIARVSFDSYVLALAHEMCHVILDATGNPLRQIEEVVDLTAMLLGFRDFYVTGCYMFHEAVDASYEERIGYLSQEEISYAAQAMTFR